VLTTISIFSVISFLLLKFGMAHYEGFRTQATNENLSATFNFIGFYTWQFFDLIPGLEINRSLGWNNPLAPSGFVTEVTTLGFRAVMVLFLLKVFKDWWTSHFSLKSRDAVRLDIQGAQQ